MEIQFHFEDINEFQLDVLEIERWIQTVASKESASVDSINYIFCSDEYLLSINREFLNHDYYTDIITFDNSEEGGGIESDIFISVDRVLDNANRLAVDENLELKRVMIHGVLHLMGYGDKTDDEEKIMRSKENTYLSLLEK